MDAVTAPDIIRAAVWTPEQQAQELGRRLEPGLQAMMAPSSFKPRSTDVIVVGPPKCGLTWVTHICHQIRTGGAEPDFNEQIPDVTTILDLSLFYLNLDPNTMVQPAEPRVFLSHYSYDTVPKGGKLIYIFRDQKDAFYSWYQYLDTEIVLKGRVSMPVFAEVFMNRAHWTANNMRNMLVWWEHRHDDDVMFLFYDDLKEKRAECVSRIAEFMGVVCDVARVVSTTSHEEMVRHHSKFDNHSIIAITAKNVGDIPPVEISGRVRKNGGKSGDGCKLPIELQKRIDEEWNDIVTPQLGFRSVGEMRDALDKETTEKRH